MNKYILNVNIPLIGVIIVGFGCLLILSYFVSKKKSAKKIFHSNRFKNNKLFEKSREKHDKLIRMADVNWGYWEYRFYCILISAVVFYMCYKWFNPFMAAIFGLASSKLLRFYLGVRIKRRKNKLQSQFNNALEYIKNEYAACFNDREALKRAYKYFKSPLKDEFKPVIQAIDIGVEYLPALKHLNELWKIKRMHMFIGIFSAISYHGSNKGLILLQGLINSAKKEKDLKAEFKAKASMDIFLLLIIMGIIPASLVFLKVVTPNLFVYYTNNMLGQIALSFVAVVEFAILLITYFYVVKEF